MKDRVTITLKALRLPNKDPLVIFCGTQMSLIEDFTVLSVGIGLGDNVIDIEFLNKSSKDTKVIDGKIVADLAVIVDKIEYKGFDFKPYLEHISDYTDYNGNKIKGTHGFMAFNGAMRIKLVGPLFLYSRDLAIQHG